MVTGWSEGIAIQTIHAFDLNNVNTKILLKSNQNNGSCPEMLTAQLQTQINSLRPSDAYMRR